MYGKRVKATGKFSNDILTFDDLKGDTVIDIYAGSVSEGELAIMRCKLIDLNASLGKGPYKGVVIAKDYVSKISDGLEVPREYEKEFGIKLVTDPTEAMSILRK